MIYVDDMEAPYRGMKMCHLIADSTEELLAMVDKIGVQRKWIQNPGGPREHFDICLAKKKLAIAAGAKEITWHELAHMTYERAKKVKRGAKDGETSESASEVAGVSAGMGEVLRGIYRSNAGNRRNGY